MGEQVLYQFDEVRRQINKSRNASKKQSDVRQGTPSCTDIQIQFGESQTDDTLRVTRHVQVVREL